MSRECGRLGVSHGQCYKVLHVAIRRETDLIADAVSLQIHQHFFNVRLDMACDDDNGGSNLMAVEVSATPGGSGACLACSHELACWWKLVLARVWMPEFVQMRGDA